MSDNGINLRGVFWPSLWYIDLGENVHLDLTVEFSESPPGEYQYNVYLKDFEENIVKSWQGTEDTQGQKVTHLKFAWDGRINGEKISYKPLRFYAAVTGGVNLLSGHQGFCSGIHPQPGPDPVDEPPSGQDPPSDPTHPVPPPDTPYPPPFPPPVPADPSGPSEDEVHMFAGALTAHMVDLNIPDIGIPITIERYYHSLGTFMSRFTTFNTCAFNFEERLIYDESDDSYRVIFPNRSVCRFIREGKNYIPCGNNHNRLEDTHGKTKVLIFKNGWKHYFDHEGKLIRIENRTGQNLHYEWIETHDHVRRVSRIISPSGRSLEFSYNIIDINNLDMTITDWSGRTLQYKVESGCISQKIDPLGNVFRYTESGESFTGLKSISPPNGTILTNEGMGGSPLSVHVTKQSPGIGADFNYQYDWDNCHTTVTRGDRKWEYFFNKNRGNLERIVDPMGYETQYSHDEKGNITGYTDQEGRTTHYVYDDAGNLISITDFLGNTTTFEYNDYGQMIKQTSPEDKVTQWEYDETTGNLLKTIDWREREAHYEYYDNGLLKKSIDFNGKINEYEYDNYGNVTKTIEDESTDTEYIYDSRGNVLKEIRKDEIMLYEYNQNDKVVKTTDHNGNATTYEYDGNSNVVKTIFPDGFCQASHLNVMNDIIAAYSNGKETTFEYDQYRQLTKVEGSNNVIAQYEYDKLGRKTKEIDSTGRVTIYNYESLSKESITDNRGKTTTTEFDKQGRLIKITYNDGSYHQYIYSQNSIIITQPGERYGEIRYGGDSYGSETYGGNTYGGSGSKYGYERENSIEYVYDEETKHLKYILYPRGKTISYQYDENDRFVGVTDIRGYKTVYQYDDNNRVIKAAYRGNEISYTYDSNNRISSVELPNGVFKTIIYKNETNNDIKGIKYQIGSDILYQVNLEFNNDRIISKTIHMLSHPQKTYRYLYDKDSRVVSVYLDGKIDVVYNYNSKGLLIQKRDGDKKTADFHYDSSNRLITAENETYRYDANGNIIEKQKTAQNHPSQYIYDNQNHLAMFVKPKGFKSSDNGFSPVNPLGLYTWRYRYYRTGEMSKKISPSGRELRFYYNNGFLLNEEGWFARSSEAEDGYQLPAGSENHKITHIVTWIYGPEESPLGIDTTPANAGPNEKCINYYLTDENNSIIALCDGFGGIIKVYEYDSEGNRREVSSDTPQSNPHTGYNPLGFKGSHSEIDTGAAVNKQTVSTAARVKEFEDLLRAYTQKYKAQWDIDKLKYLNEDKNIVYNEYMCWHHAYLITSDHFKKHARDNGYFVITKVVFWPTGQGHVLDGHFGVYIMVIDLNSRLSFDAFTDVNRMAITNNENYKASKNVHDILKLTRGSVSEHSDYKKGLRIAAGHAAGGEKTFMDWVDNLSKGIK